MSYWCHACLRGFTIASVNCPHCGSDFIEWSNEPVGDDEEDDTDDLEENYFDGEFEQLPILFPRRDTNQSNQSLDYSDLARWFVNLGMGNMGNMGNGGRRVNLEDYGIGQSFDDILNMTFEQHQGNGPPPAAKKELERLKKNKITKDQVASNLECTICTEKYRVYEQCDILPCKHFFHQDCIRPWLELHNTCPVCRFELRTDDMEYEAKKKKVSNITPTINSDPMSTITDTPTIMTPSMEDNDDGVPQEGLPEPTVISLSPKKGRKPVRLQRTGGQTSNKTIRRRHPPTNNRPTKKIPKSKKPNPQNKINH